MKLFLILVVAFVSCTKAALSLQCYKCDDVASCASTSTWATTSDICTGTCQKITTKVGAADPVVTKRQCLPGAPPARNRCVAQSVDSTASGTTVTTVTTTCSCDTTNCNGDPMPVENAKTSCYICGPRNGVSSGDSCKNVNFNPTGTGVSKDTCLGGVPCVTIREEALDGAVVAVTRGCAIDPNSPVNDVTYRRLDNGNFESSTYCNSDNCNNQLTSAAKPVTCYTCNGTDSCQANPFKYTETDATITIDKCPAKIPCLTIRKENANGTVISVQRRCSTSTTPSEGCSFGIDVNGDRESRCYCRRDNCNDRTTGSVYVDPISCYTCGTGASAASCAKAPFDPAATDVTPVKCMSGAPCLTTRRESADGKALTGVDRMCSPEVYPASVDRCHTETLPTGEKQTKCYCKTDRCNMNTVTVTDSSSTTTTTTPKGPNPQTTPKGAGPSNRPVAVSFLLVVMSVLAF